MARKASTEKEGLREYRRKRDLKRSPEPEPAAGMDAGSRFVIQQHSARRLHWDLRLEHDGVLASWALPKGLPERTDRNNKAIRTEDHPIEYLEFEGEIPKGQYGAGTMEIWDSGTYETDKFRDDEVIVTLLGERASGKYALFQAGESDKDWLIHRMDEPAEAAEPLPEQIVPMMARLAELPADEEGWAFEIKWDGVRAIAYSTPGDLRLESRNLKDITARYPELRRLNRQLGSRSAILDGEIVSFEGDAPSFEKLQRRMHLTREPEIRRLAKAEPVSFQIFDLLYLDGRSLMAEPYEERRRLLDELELSGDAWQTPAFHSGDGAALLARTAELGLEGVVAKRLNSHYLPGARNRDWLKVKNVLRQEFVIAGWLPQKGRRSELGALLVGHNDGGELRFAGKVGTGFNREQARELVELLQPLARKGSPFAGRQPERGANFVEPELVAEVDYGSMTREGMLRHPSYKGLRSDKEASEVVLERPEDPSAPPFDVNTLKSSSRGVMVEVEGRELKLTNLDKVLYPKVGFSKRQVIDYYARIAPVLAPHLADRPLTLKRYPDGVEGKHFFEKKCPSHRPDWVETAVLPSERRGEIRFCTIGDLPGLVWLANLADLELHPSLSLAADRDHPTAIAFDLDPGPGTTLLDCCEVGLWISGMLERLGIRCFPKVSGKKGLHVFAPLGATADYERTKPFAREVAETLEARFPDRVTANMAKSRRQGRVLVDWSQNDPHKTTLAVYSLRATERPQVSVPLRWEEIEAALEEESLSSLVFGPEEALARVEEEGDLFAPMLSMRQELPG
ncbi:MAG TPA: DNA ligase D [Solirubrobacterales bacterium]|nr:DNA ligase D [Solirubrobacterales bacterium]